MRMDSEIKIGNKFIGEDSPCFVIAEAGSNHNRRLSQAKKLIDAARDAKADAVKFQIYSAQTLYSKRVKALPGEKGKPFDVIKEIETPREWLSGLADYSKRQGLIFLATPFDKESIDQMDLFVPAFKWASPELIDRPLLEYAARKGKPLIISTGFYGLKEVVEAIKWIEGVGNTKVILLHCTGLYPTLAEEVNLKAMIALKRKFQVPVGFSDHTLDTITAAAAVALGAKVIEKHFTLNRVLSGPDHRFALEPEELKEMVSNIRIIEKALGTGIKEPVKREINKERLIRRGIVAESDLKKGEKLTIDSITIKRSGAGAILPKYFYKILNRKARVHIKTDEKITWKMI